jgi:hypothetical protein
MPKQTPAALAISAFLRVSRACTASNAAVQLYRIASNGDTIAAAAVLAFEDHGIVA